MAGVLRVSASRCHASVCRDLNVCKRTGECHRVHHLSDGLLSVLCTVAIEVCRNSGRPVRSRLQPAGSLAPVDWPHTHRQLSLSIKHALPKRAPPFPRKVRKARAARTPFMCAIPPYLVLFVVKVLESVSVVAL